MVGAVLTQNTAWVNVEKAIQAIRAKHVLSLAGLSRLSDADLSSLIRPAGYYNQKTKTLRAFLAFLKTVCDGRLAALSRFSTPDLREKLLRVRGVGPETADSILLYALNRPVFVVDAYTRRIFSRLRMLSGNEPYEEIRSLFEQDIFAHLDGHTRGQMKKGTPENRFVRISNQFHACIVETAKRFCRKKNPDCHLCPLSEQRACFF